MEKNRISIDILDFSIHTNNVLNSANILFIDELENKTAADILSMQHCGLKTLREIRKELARYGTCLRDDYVANAVFLSTAMCSWILGLV